MEESITPAIKKASQIVTELKRQVALEQTQHKGGYVNMHPKELLETLQESLSKHWDNDSKVVSCNIRIKCIDKNHIPFGIKEMKIY